ncbi:hypothetical protein [Spirosoma luteum]|uniref:hypothetical protein n=1 Tax=Spirosoma luteum TaxID=431553 RepID=UPI00037342D2|nr:hypothetical protein [Spirosoma luteum]
MEKDGKTQDTDRDETAAGPDYLVGEETENVKPTGVDDNSTGREGDDYLGKSNLSDE